MRLGRIARLLRRLRRRLQSGGCGASRREPGLLFVQRARLRPHLLLHGQQFGPRLLSRRQVLGRFAAPRGRLRNRVVQVAPCRVHVMSQRRQFGRSPIAGPLRRLLPGDSVLHFRQPRLQLGQPLFRLMNFLLQLLELCPRHLSGRDVRLHFGCAGDGLRSRVIQLALRSLGLPDDRRQSLGSLVARVLRRLCDGLQLYDFRS